MPGTPTEDVHAAYKRLGATLGDEPAFAAVGSLGSCLQSARGTMQAGARAKRLRAATAAYAARLGRLALPTRRRSANALVSGGHL